MANVREIKKKGSPSSYMGRVLISVEGEIVYNKSKTFAKKKLANEWAVTHEVEVRKTKPWVKVKRSEPPVSQAFDDYIAKI